MSKVYFMSVQYLKDSTPINLNVEESLISMSIIDSQTMQIQLALGSKLYKKLEDLIIAGTLSSNTNYKTLMDDYVLPALIQWSLADCLMYIKYKIMNKSVSTQSSDNSTPIELEDLKYMHQNIINKAEFQTQRLCDYLLAHMTLFPEYNAAKNIDELSPAGNAYFSGIVLDDNRDCTRFLGLNSHTIDLLW